MKTIALANQEGSVGKTTTASLGIGLSRQSKFDEGGAEPWQAAN